VGHVIERHRWDELGKVAVGGHLHLDEVVSDPPAPGSHDWLAYMGAVVDHLVGEQDRWIVKLPLGFVSTPPPELASANDIFLMVERGEDLMEQPSVNRLGPSNAPSTWEGQNVRWQWCDRPGVTTVVSVSRSLRDRVDGEPFSCALLYEIR
jgi:hypothetical protein